MARKPAGRVASAHGPSTGLREAPVLEVEENGQVNLDWTFTPPDPPYWRVMARLVPTAPWLQYTKVNGNLRTYEDVDVPDFYKVYGCTLDNVQLTDESNVVQPTQP